MADEGFKRKLTAILSADVAGYSRLMAEDETSTVKTIATYREIIASLIKQHRGRVVDSPGDNVLAEFSSVVDAVQCAVAVQNEIQTQNAELPDNRKMEFRIGVNLGDVIDEEDRIYGDGVNIAARLEAMADPGGICVSKTAFDQIETKLPLGYEYLGEQPVKNIPKPVGAYRVLMKPDAAGKVIGEKKFLGRYSRKTAMAAIIIFVAVAAGLVGWNIYLQQSKTVEPTSVEKMAFPLPDKPSIAVLPFRNLSGDPEQEFLSDGFTEDIITALAKLPRMFVIARESSFTYKGKSAKAQDVGRDLGVRHVLEGSIQKYGDRIRISAQLIDAQNGHHLWAEKFDRDQQDIFKLQDAVIREIAMSLEIELTEGEWLPRWGGITDSFDAYIKVRQSLEHFREFTPDGIILSRQKAKEALKLDPNYSAALQMLSWTLSMDGVYGTSKTPEKSIEQAFELAQKALDNGDDDAGAHYLLGFIYIKMGQFEKGVSEVKIARDLNPASAEIQAGLGMILSSANRPKEAIPPLKKAIRLNPIPPSWYFRHLGGAYRKTEQYEKAILEFRKAIQLQPDNMFAHMHLALCYVNLNRLEDARAEAAEVLRIDPDFSAARYINNISWASEEAKQRRIDEMRKAGFPE
jgi:adenylate cyclase